MFMGEHMPLHACACLDHACRVCLCSQGNLLVCLGIYRLSIFDPTPLYLFKESSAVEAHVRARWSFNQAVVEMVSGDRTFIPTHAVAQPVRDCTLFRKMPMHHTIFALT